MEQTTKLTFNMLPMSIGVLPSSYVDSMSYYETLLWLINYLENTVIPTVNNNSDVTTELQAKYIELKSYVEHYFDNLDVQEEINNKLDEMVQEGTLQEIISDYLNSKAIFAFDNVELMKESTNLIDGSYAETLGYYAKDDGGKSLYKVRKITNEDVVDEALIIALADETLIAELIVETEIEPKQFGAKGGNNDDGVILNKVIQYAYSNNKQVKFAYDYKTSIPLALDKAGLLLTITRSLTYTGSDTAILITNNVNILKINEITSSGAGITLSCSGGLERCNIEVEKITATKNGIELLSTAGGSVYHIIKFTCILAGPTYSCIYVDANETSGITYVGEVTFYGGKCQRGAYGVYATANVTNRNSAIKLYNLCFEGVTNGIYFNNVSASPIVYPRYAELENGEGFLLSLNGRCDENTFLGNAPIIPSKIVLNIASSPQWTARRVNYINAPFFTSGGVILGKYGYASVDGLTIVPFEVKVANVYAALDNHEYNNNEVIPSWFLGNSDSTIILGESYNPIGINRIYVQYDGTTRLLIKDRNNNTVHDGSTLTVGVYAIDIIRNGSNIEYHQSKLS